MFEIKVEAKNVMSALERLAHTGQDMSPVMRVIAQELERQTEKNFAAEGRPKWLGLSRSTLEGRVMARTKTRDGAIKKGAIRKDGRISKSIGSRVGGQILQDTGQLAASITTSHDSRSAMIGTNKIYAAIHQFGGTIEHPGSDKFQAFEIGGQWVYTHGTKPHPIAIPARPYMMFQDADVEQIIQILGDKIVSSIKFVDASGNSSASSVVA